MAQDKPTINVTSHDQSGGITAYQVNIGHVYLTFNEQVAAAILQRIPKDKPIDAKAVGSTKDWQVAEQYFAYLQQAGFSIRSYSKIGMLAPPPDQPVTIRVAPDHIVIIVSPRT